MFDFIKTGYVSYFIIIITALVTYVSWKKPSLQNALISTGPSIIKNKQWYRTVTSSLLHLDMAHLFWNMFALYNLGPILEDQFQTYFGESWFLWFGIFYFATAVLSDIPSAIQHRNDEQYSTLGASGAVSAVIAAASIIDLKLELYIYGIPMYGWLYLVIYLIVSFFLSRRSQQSVNHLAHASGALVAVAVAFLIAHAGIITSVYPTSQDYNNGYEDSVEVMALLNDANNGYVWIDNSSKYGTIHSLAYLSTKNGKCDAVFYRSEADLLADTDSFQEDTYNLYGQLDGLDKTWILINSGEEKSPCNLATKLVFDWE